VRSFVSECLDAAQLADATYADVRVVDQRTQQLSVRTGRLEALESSSTLGFGVRVIADGAWGFASSALMTPEEALRVARQAVAIAKASARVPGPPVELSELGAYTDSWSGSCRIDPFSVSTEDKLALLLHADELMRAEPAVKITGAQLTFLTARKWFGSTLGSFIEQTWTESGGGIVAYAVEGGEVLPRSYPNSHGGGHWQAGWEAIEACDLAGNATRVAEQAAALLSAKECPAATTTVIIDGSQIGLQVHESIGHPTELDRVLGDEAAFAGTSFLKLEDIGTLRYGSEHVTVTADATVPGSLGSFGYDDEGVPAQRDFLVKDGILAGFLGSRQSAPAIGRASNGCMRADGFDRIPIIRMTTVSLEPGEWSLDDLIADTGDGLYIETNNSWSIDDKRLNFQFATEIGWEIKDGRLGAMVKSPNYTGITPKFWGSCDAVCSPDHWRVWGLPNCGKGQPMQVAHVAHGAAPARFRDVQGGVGR
jgi:TldD protein